VGDCERQKDAANARASAAEVETGQLHAQIARLEQQLETAQRELLSALR